MTGPGRSETNADVYFSAPSISILKLDRYFVFWRFENRLPEVV
jgi:hypothetical protein